MVYKSAKYPIIGEKIAKPNCPRKLEVEIMVALLLDETSKFNKWLIIGFLKPKNIEGIMNKPIAIYFGDKVASKSNNGEPKTAKSKARLFPIFSETL